jgi:hypothetical protein
MSGGAMSMIMMGMDQYAREVNLVDMYSLAPACAAMTVPAPMSNVPMVAEVKSDSYTLLAGSIGYPYSVGDKWEYISELDTYLSSFGMCASLLAPLPPSLSTAEVMAVGVTNPDGGFADCVQIDTYSIAQIDNDKDKLFNEDPVDGVDNDGDTLTDEDPVETDVTMQDNDGDSAVNEDPIDGVDNDGDTLTDEDPVDVKCTTSLWWSPTALAMVETHNPCSYDLQENKVLIDYHLEP